jgi:hypothetical protein
MIFHVFPHDSDELVVWTISKAGQSIFSRNSKKLAVKNFALGIVFFSVYTLFAKFRRAIPAVNDTHNIENLTIRREVIPLIASHGEDTWSGRPKTHNQ